MGAAAFGAAFGAAFALGAAWADLGAGAALGAGALGAGALWAKAPVPIKAVSIVVGHLLGVLAAHERAITVLDRRAAVIGQVPLMVVMVFYTLGGLTILFAP